MKTAASHLVTVLIAVGVVMVLFGPRIAPERAVPVVQVPRRGGAGLAAPAAPYRLPAVAPPALPADILARSDADEQINIRVYDAVNRSVVNITSAVELSGLFGDEETAGGAGSGFVIDRQG